MASQNISACKAVRPLLSKDFYEARRRAIGLYKAFYRQIPYILKYYDIAKSERDCRNKLREFFYKNACIRDVRVVDMLVIKGYMELAEMKYMWMQKGRVLANWNPTIEPRPSDFLGKFLNGLE